jgi:hypothetical protein
MISLAITPLLGVGECAFRQAWPTLADWQHQLGALNLKIKTPLPSQIRMRHPWGSDRGYFLVFLGRTAPPWVARRVDK